MNRMKKFFIGLLCAVLVLGAALGALYYRYGVSMSHLPEGELIATYDFDEADYKVNIYLCNGGATTAYAVRGEVVFPNNKERNIYWQYREEDAKVSSVDKDTVSINGHEINVYKGKYDFRREK